MAVHPVELMDDPADLATRLASTGSVLDVLAVLTETGRQHGYDAWLVVVPDPRWQGFLFSTVPVLGRAVQWHAHNLIEHLIKDDPTLTPPPRRVGAIPVQAACAEWGQVQPDCKRWHDFAVTAGRRRICTARVARFDGDPPAGWERAGEMLRTAAPYLAFHLAPSRDVAAPMIDPTTGLYSAAFFRDQLEREVQRAAAYAAELTLMLIDFKPRAGVDMVDNASLRAAASVLSHQTRRTDICARLDLTRLAVLMPHTGARAGLIAATRIEETLRRETDVCDKYSVSIGISGWNLQGPDETELLRQAEAAARAAAEANTGTPFVYV